MENILNYDHSLEMNFYKWQRNVIENSW